MYQTANIDVDADEADIKILEDSLSKCSTLSQELCSSLKNLSAKAARSERAIRPMALASAQLNIYNKNVNECLGLLASIENSASELRRNEELIRFKGIPASGLSIVDKITSVGLGKYLNAINACRRIQADMRANQLDRSFSRIFSDTEKLIADGENSLLEYFKGLVEMASRDVFDPKKVIADRQPFPYPDDNLIDRIKLAAETVAQTKLAASMNSVYVAQRKQLIQACLKPVFPASISNPTIQRVPTEVHIQELSLFSEAILGFLSNELQLVADIGQPVRFFKPVGEEILESYYEVLGKMVRLVESKLASEGLLVFELYRSVAAVSSFVAQSVNDKISDLRDAISVAQLRKYETTCRELSQRLFKEFLRFVDQRVSGLSSIPSDNGVSEITIEIMSKIRKFGEYGDTAMKAMEGITPGSWIPSPKPAWLATFSSIPPGFVPSGDRAELFASYLCDTLDALMVGLELRAKALMPSSLKGPHRASAIGYFLVTNLTLVEQIVARYPDFAKSLGSIGAARIERLKKRAVNQFLETWKSLASHLMDVTVMQGGTLTSKEKDAIKEKFKSFNAEFDEQVAKFQQLNIADPALKSYLAKELRFISPLYYRFYDKNSNGEFSKHAEKYIKYTKQDVDRILDSLG